MLARVVLKKAKTYTLGGRRWIKDVPGRVEGEDQVKAYQENGYFSVTVLEGSKKKKKKKKGSGKKSGKTSKSSSKKKTKKLKKNVDA